MKLTLTEGSVIQARRLTDKRSGMVESPLAGNVVRLRQQDIAKAKILESTVAIWNDFNAKRGSFADEYSSL